MDMETFAKQIRTSLTLGEGQVRAFISVWEGSSDQRHPRDVEVIATEVAETLVALANADGGELFVGVEADGTISGMPDEMVSVLSQAPRYNIHIDTQLEKPIVLRVPIDGMMIVYVAVKKGPFILYHYTREGRCLLRRDRQNLVHTPPHLDTT